jgi:hypothetical protein
MGKRESLVPALAAAVSGLLGVVVGAVVSGHYQLESQRITAQQSENAAQYETSRAAAQSLVKGAAEYLAELAYLVTAGKTPEKIENLDERMRVLYRSAFELSLQTTIPTAQKIFESNVYVSEVMAAAREPAKLTALEAEQDSRRDVPLHLYGCCPVSGHFRAHSGP